MSTIKQIKEENQEALAGGFWATMSDQLASSDYAGDRECLTKISIVRGQPDWFNYVDRVKSRFFSDITLHGIDGYLDYSMRHSTIPMRELHIYFEHADLDTPLDDAHALVKSMEAQACCAWTMPVPTVAVPGKEPMTLSMARRVPMKMAKGMFVDANQRQMLIPILPTLPYRIVALVAQGHKEYRIDPRIESIVIHTPKRSHLAAAVRSA